MRMLGQKITLSEEGYIVSSGYLRDLYDESTHQQFLPITMNVLECETTNMENGIDHFVSQDILVLGEGQIQDEDFVKDYLKILQGESHDWFLAYFQVKADAVELHYRKIEDRKSDGVLILLNNGTLKLRFEVPHFTGRPASVYQLEAYSFSRQHGIIEYETTVTEFTEQPLRKIEFVYSSDQPYAADRIAYLTEYVDI